MDLMKTEITLFWFRRDLRLDDNAGLYHALKENKNVLPLFIFDPSILKGLPQNDARVLFIHQNLLEMKRRLQSQNTDLLLIHGHPLAVFQDLVKKYKIKSVYTNHDYEPAATERDEKIRQFLDQQQIDFKTFKDQCIFEKKEVLSQTQTTYTVFTPYKKKWLSQVTPFYLKSYPCKDYGTHFLAIPEKTPDLSLKEMGFKDFDFKFPEIPSAEGLRKILKSYAEKRDFPGMDATSRLGLHLRFGTVSVRALAREAEKYSEVWLSELIWRDFFMQILWHFPRVTQQSFRPQYDQIKWRQDNSDFKKWCDGTTGYPMVDAGMREMNQTGFMHNRVRMVTASFLTKHLLIYWLEGERYFAEKLLDYDLSANNGNWQWAAGTGCDAAPYFRIFNPEAQMNKFDPDLAYVKKWVPEYGTKDYPKPMVDHVFARERALTEFKKGLK